jgi:hypothetical protein
VPHLRRSPDFLLRFMALMHFMRLSLRKGAHAVLSGAAWQENPGRNHLLSVPSPSGLG